MTSHAASALGVAGTPVDLDVERGPGEDARGRQIDAASGAARRFDDGEARAEEERYRALPMPTRGALHNRFVGDHLPYGSEKGWWNNTSEVGSTVFVVPWRDGGGEAELITTHAEALPFGAADSSDLNLSLVMPTAHSSSGTPPRIPQAPLTSFPRRFRPVITT